MVTTKHKAYATIASALTTELNSLASNGNSAASSAIDNTTALDLFADLEINLATQGSARVASATIYVYMTQALDGTNYGDTNEVTAEVIAAFIFDAATTARRATLKDVPIPPGLFKLFVRNVTGQALAASGNTLKYRLHSVETS